MSHKRPRLGQDDRKQRAKRSRWSKQHLYLALDDWHKGFTVHKMDTDDDHQHSHHLPEPPLLRVEAPNDDDHRIDLSASDAKIFVAMNQLLAVGAHVPPRMVSGSGVCMPVGDVLYLLSRRVVDGKARHSFEAMSWSSPAADPTGGAWACEALPDPPPTFTGRQVVVAHAVHPDWCTIFMTTAIRGAPRGPLGTYSFNTRDGLWRWHGECALPFTGEGHYDAGLGAWVGLHMDGYMCSCKVIPPDFVSTRRLNSDWWWGVDPNVYLDHQITENKLFNERCITASLTCMGGTGRFCLVESVASDVTKMPVFGDNGDCALNVTIFGLEYGHKGKLQTTNDTSTRSFLVSRHRCHFEPFAVWM